MKALWAAAVVLAVLAIGGLPALALTMAADDTGSSGDSSAAAQWQPGDGAPPWSNGDHADDKATEKDAAKAEKRDKAEKHADKARGDRGAGHAGNQHGVQMRAWAHCVAGADKPADDASPDASTGPDAFDPEQACGERPAPPGRSGR